MATDYEGFKQHAREAGESEEQITNTVRLFEAIEKVLADEDVDPFMAPEMIPEKKVRLARVFIEEHKRLISDADKAIARWLRSNATEQYGVRDEAAELLAKAVREGVHWKWWHEIGKTL